MIIRLIITIYLDSIHILTGVSLILSQPYLTGIKFSVVIIQKQPRGKVTEPALSSPAGSPVVPRKHTAGLPSPSLEG